MTRILFLCGKARMRSPTAARLAADMGAEADFAGLSHDADEALTAEHLAWAEIICPMEPRQARRLRTLFGPQLRGKRVVVLGVPDLYTRDDPALVARLEPMIRRVLRRPI